MSARRDPCRNTCAVRIHTICYRSFNRTAWQQSCCVNCNDCFQKAFRKASKNGAACRDTLPGCSGRKMCADEARMQCQPSEYHSACIPPVVYSAPGLRTAPAVAHVRAAAKAGCPQVGPQKAAAAEIPAGTSNTQLMT